MNLLDFKQTSSYFTKKKPIVALLFVFSVFCLLVSIQSGAVLLHSFLSAYIEQGAQVLAYSVAISVDCVLFYLCAQLFSDLFCGVDGKKHYLDFPTLTLCFLFLSLSLFFSIRGADIRKSQHAATIAQDKTAQQVIDKLVQSVDTSKMVHGADVTRNTRKNNGKIVEARKEQTEQNAQILSALNIHASQQEQEKKSFSELLDFSKTIVIIFQLLLIVCTCCSEYIKSKRDSIKNNSNSGQKQPNSTDKQGDSKSNSKKESKNAIGFSRPTEGHILNKTIAYKKGDGTLKYYKSYQLTSMITDAKRKGKEQQVRRLTGLKQKLVNQK